MKRIALLSLAAAVFVGCQDEGLPTGTDLGPPSAAISDGTHALGNRDFFFLPSMVPDPSGNLSDARGGLYEPGAFNPNVAPVVTICALSVSVPADILPETSCAAPADGFPLTFTTTTGPGSETVRLNDGALEEDKFYIVNWHTDLFTLSPIHRITVSLGGTRLGFADVQVVEGKDLKNVQTGDFVALKDGRTLAIKVRIERFALCDDTRDCVTSSVGTGGDRELEVPGPGDLRVLYRDQGEGGAVGTLTLSRCSEADEALVDGRIDLPVFGPCLESETDFVGQDLLFPATISVCDLSAFTDIGDLTLDQQERLTLYHFSDIDDGIDALPEANVCPEPVASLPTNPFMRLARAIGDRILNFGSPRPLQAAAMRRINRGGGGDADEMESRWKFALPAKIVVVPPAAQTLLGGTQDVELQALATDLGGDPVENAKVTFALPSAPGGDAAISTTAPVLTGADGIAKVQLDMSATEGDHVVTAGGRGLATEAVPGPRGNTNPFGPFDPYVPIQFDEEVGDGIEDPGAETTFNLPAIPNPDLISFTVTGAYPDLVVTSLSHTPANPNTADEITFTATVQNQGLVAAPVASSFEFQIVGDDASTTTLSVSVLALAAGDDQTVNANATLTTAQDYTSTAVADADNVVTETELPTAGFGEGNNDDQSETFSVVLFMRVAGIGANSGNTEADDIFSSGDLPGSITRLTEAEFNAKTNAQLVAEFDVLLITWNSTASLNVDWTTRLLPFLNAGGGVIYDGDPNNVADLAPGIGNAAQLERGGSNITVTASIPGLTNGIVNSFVNNHVEFTTTVFPVIPAGFTQFLKLTETHDAVTHEHNVGIYGPVGAGCIVLTGPDQDFHGVRGGSGAGLNQYNLLINELTFVTKIGGDKCVPPAP